MREHLLAHPEKYDFFQAVRILQRGLDGDASGGAKIGRDHLPKEECVRFRTLASLSFPPSDVAHIRALDDRRAEMEVTFIGLTGPVGVLPEHYTRLLLERMRLRDNAMREFLELFQHRVVSLFYRAWEKHHIPAEIEREGGAAVEGFDEDAVFTRGIFATAGMAEASLKNRQVVPDQVFLYYAGYFSDGRRPAESLERMLSEYFGLPVEVESFVGQWLRLDRENRSRLPLRTQDAPAHNMLGDGLVLGERVWDVQSKFRVHVGPLNRQQFARLLPNGDALQPLIELTRSYVGAEFDFDVKLILRGDDVPPCMLGGDEGTGTRLGWNSWLGCQTPKDTVSDAVFASQL